jgi:thiamine pyrophosphokinase
MKKVLIVGNGNDNSKEFYIRISSEADFIIGVDRGAEVLLAAGVKPGIAIGDFDSVTNFADIKYSGIEILKFPAEKDKSDTELAIDYAVEKNFDLFVFSGMLGKRTDQTLFNIALIVKLYRSGRKCSIIEEGEELHLLLSEKRKFQVRIGDVISLFPVDKVVYGVSTDGLKYALREKDLSSNSTLSLSNIAEKEEISIFVRSGMLLVIIERQA